MKNKQRIVIIGAGPAGLTAAYELALKKHDVIVLETEGQVGGISKTIDYKGNKIDIGGHRFFSKSDWVLTWWQQFLPIFSSHEYLSTTYQNQKKDFKISKQADSSLPHMMVRPRKSRIYHGKKLFDYPLKLNFRTFMNIGVWKSVRIFVSLLASRLKRSKEQNLEDFLINRFGKVLYTTFFKDYTEKVWGKPCTEISAEWGHQRIQGLSLRTIVKHYLTTVFSASKQGFGNKETEQTLTEYFLYPQKGPGQLWEAVADACREEEVDIRLNQKVVGIHTDNGKLIEIEVHDSKTQKNYTIPCKEVISSMPIKNLIRAMGTEVPKCLKDIAASLEYRDFLIVGLLLKDMKLKDHANEPITDNWIYIQESEVKVGRVQLFHNWSADMVADSEHYWIGAEYFCQKGDWLWNKSEEELILFASKELNEIGLIDTSQVLDGTVVRMPKAYPSYVGSYEHFDKIKTYLSSFENLFQIGRNGTHKYNNQDHSMITAREAVQNIVNGRKEKTNIWDVNTEDEYNESK